MTMSEAPVQTTTMFENPFQIEDLMVFDDPTLQILLTQGSFGLTIEAIAQSLQDADASLQKRIQRNLLPQYRALFLQELQRPLPYAEREKIRRHVLNTLFWELTYWKTPDLYEELTMGEQIHPGIFQNLRSDLYGKTVLDVGAGSGRASFECMRQGAKHIYAVEPSPGLLHILKQKLHQDRVDPGQITLKQGHFDAIPLPDNSIDTTIACSAFTSAPQQGGEPGLAEIRRVTKPDGKIVIIWPRLEDHEWLQMHDFNYVTLPTPHEMCIHFHSLYSALHCIRRFYAKNVAATRYILTKHRPEIPFSLLGVNPPCDYYWLTVKK